MFKVGVTLFSLILAISRFAEACTNPEITSTSYTTQDATVVTNIAFIADFTFKCSNAVNEPFPLYAEVNGNVFPAIHIGKDRYQVSWTDEIGKSRSGDYSVNLYDEEGYAALRKAFRNYESVRVKPLGAVNVNHPGSYQGPWVNSEFMAAVLAVVVWYLAFTAKSKLLQ